MVNPRAHHGEQPNWMITLASMIGQIGLPGGGYGLNYHYSSNGVPMPAAATGNPTTKADADAQKVYERITGAFWD